MLSNFWRAFLLVPSKKRNVGHPVGQFADYGKCIHGIYRVAIYLKENGEKTGPAHARSRLVLPYSANWPVGIPLNTSSLLFFATWIFYAVRGNIFNSLVLLYGCQYKRIDHFTVVCSVTWPLIGSEAGGDLVLIKMSLLLLCKSSCSNVN